MAKTSKPGGVKAQANQRGRKKSAPTGSGNSKRHGKNALRASSRLVTVRDLEAGDTESYLGLRQAFDSFQAVILYYYATGENTQQRIERAEEIKTYLRSFTRRAPRPLGDEDPECPPGTRPCSGGDCVPIYITCSPRDEGT
jgi:hypothetical protein